MKAVDYTADAANALKHYSNIVARPRRALDTYAADPAAHANNVTQLAGSSAKRMRIGDFRVVFEETAERMLVTRIGPRGDVYRLRRGGQGMGVQTIRTPGGEELVLLGRQDYEDLIDARDHAAALAQVAAGTMATLSAAELDEFLAAPTPLAFWRRKRCLTQAQLAEQAGLSQPYLAQIEGGKRQGDPGTLLTLARALRVRMEDLVDEGGHR